MNTVDCYVTLVLSRSYRKFGNWWVDVQYDSYDHISETQLMFSTEHGAASVSIGHKFQA